MAVAASRTKAAPKAAAKSTPAPAAPAAEKPAAAAKAPAAKATTTKATKAKKEAVDRAKLAQRAANLLKQVSDPTRLRVILMLHEGEKHVGALSEHLNMSQPAVSHHLALLRHGGIIVPRRQGKNNYYALSETGEELAEVVKTVIA